MKKILYSIFALVMALPAVASAATFGFTPVSGVFVPGKTFSTTVSVNPKAGEKITTAKMDLSFPANLVEVVSFTQASGWVPLAVPGYNLTDNTKGELIKSGGFPAKVTASKEFGTITFKIKAPGAVMVQTTKNSVLLDSNNANKYSAGSYIKFTAVKPAPAKPKVKPPVKHKTVVKRVVKKVVAPVTKEVVAHPIAVKATSTASAVTNATSTDVTSATSSGITAFPLTASAEAPASGDNTKLALIVLAILAVVVILWINRKRIFKR